jgi:transmembrane sensor
MEQSIRIAELITRQIKGSISVEERKELDAWINLSAENRASYNRTVAHQNQLQKLDMYNSFDKEKAWQNIEDELFPVKVISLWSRTFKYAAAFLIPIMMATGLAYFLLNQEEEVPLITLDETIKPGVQKATLVLSTGVAHVLDQENTDTQLTDANSEINNSGNALTYLASNNEPAEFQPAVYNDLITPKGGGYKLQLADGSNVWLNADSKLSFPVAFTDSTRHLYLEGEAYFEVAHNGSPFIVTSDEMDIRVLGTSFNISAYQDDEDMMTTLVEGKVRIDLRSENTTTRKILSPNEQATIGSEKTQIVVADVDASQYKSWVDGKFEFHNETLESVLKKLARWYDFDYEFSNQQARNFHFSGRLDNQEKISSILHMLELTTNVSFAIEEDKIIVQ